MFLFHWLINRQKIMEQEHKHITYAYCQFHTIISPQLILYFIRQHIGDCHNIWEIVTNIKYLRNLLEFYIVCNAECIFKEYGTVFLRCLHSMVVLQIEFMILDNASCVLYAKYNIKAFVHYSWVQVVIRPVLQLLLFSIYNHVYNHVLPTSLLRSFTSRQKKSSVYQRML